RGAGMPTSMACSATPIVITAIVSSFNTFCKLTWTQNRRSHAYTTATPGGLSLDLKQRREERVLGFKHQFENVLLAVEGLRGDVLESRVDELLPLPTTLGIVLGPDATVHGGGRVFAADSVEAGASGDGGQPPSLTVNNFHQQFINEVAGSVVQNVQIGRA